MSDLQLSLLALGAVIIAAVILFNWWQERRFMQESIRRFEQPVDDILMDDFQIDPERVVAFETDSILVEDRFAETILRDDVLLEELHPRTPMQEKPEPAPAPQVPEPQFTPQPMKDPEPPEERFLEAEEPVQEEYEESFPEEAPPEETVEAVPVQSEPPVAEPVQAASAAKAPKQEAAKEKPAPSANEPVVSTMPPEVDEQIDLIGKAALPSPLDIDAFILAVRQMPKFDKPVHWFLQDETGMWRALAPELPSGRYPQMACALQLADRAGPVSQGTLMAFQEQVQNLATILGAKLAWHGSLDPLQYAMELDRFCIDVDVMVGFHIIQGPTGPFAGTKLRGLTEAAGLKLHDDGAFHCENAEGKTLYTLISQDQRPFKAETLRTVFYRGVSFQLDVPKVSSSSDAFDRMVTFARQLESALDGVLVDDNQRALGEIEIEKIRQQLKMIHAKMVARFILPGTPAALRLFS
jgi:FtsZ-interacting cell division protein ZipA